MLLEILHVGGVVVDSFSHQQYILGMLLGLTALLARLGRAECDSHYEGTAQVFEKEKKKSKNSALANINTPIFS